MKSLRRRSPVLPLPNRVHRKLIHRLVPNAIASICPRSQKSSTPALALVADGYCIRCHGDLHRADEKLSPIAQSVVGFTGQQPPLFQLPHGYSGLRFDHWRHVTFGVPNAAKEIVHLKCQDCHEIKEDGRDMGMVSYEQHCQRGHPLSIPLEDNFSSTELKALREQFITQPAPHEKPRVVWENVATRYGELIEENPELVPQPKIDQPVRGVSGKPEPVVMTHTPESWRANQLGLAKKPLFAVSGRCHFCHRYSTLPRQGELPHITPTRMRSYWFSHAVFHHKNHAEIDCLRCHTGARNGRLADETMIPNKDACQECHFEPRSGLWKSDPIPAPNGRCVSCHRYHDADREHRIRQLGSPTDFRCPLI